MKSSNTYQHSRFLNPCPLKVFIFVQVGETTTDLPEALKIHMHLPQQVETCLYLHT